jgi:hypothetical protein
LVGKPLAWLMTAVLLAAASGASCPQLLQQYTQLPRALPPAATQQQVIDVVNSNSAGIVSLYTSRGAISVPGLPSLRAMIAFQRDRNFRLRADTAFTGTEVDIGSNDQLFWFWIKRNQPPGLFFCRYDQFASSAARPLVPIEPDWLIRALGVVTFEPGVVHQGPTPISAGRLEIRTPPVLPGGNTRVTVIDASRGVVLEEHVYNAQGTRLATALLTRHRRDPATGITLPRRVDLQLPAANNEIGIDLTDLQINQLNPAQTELWTKPSYPGYAEVDLADPNLRLAPAATAASPQQVPLAPPPALLAPPQARTAPQLSAPGHFSAPGQYGAPPQGPAQNAPY